MAKTPTGIRARHARSCRHKTGRCNCTPSYEAHVFSARENAKIRKSFRSLAEAKSWRAAATVAVGRGELKSPVRRTLREEAEAWIERAERGEVLSRKSQVPLKPSVVRTYTGDLRTYVLDDLGDKRLSEIQRRDVQALVDRLRATKASDSKVRNVVTALKALLRRPLRDGDMTVNPTVDLELPPPPPARSRSTAAAEASALLDALPESERALWATALYAGLRRGELRGLRCQDVDLKAGKINVRRGWDDVAGEITPKSTKGTRTVPVPGALRPLLLAHMARTGRRGTNLVFGRTATEPFTPTHVRATARKAWTAAKLAPIGLHECRHAYVSMMHAAGLSLEQIGDYVGHSSASMTEQYRHLIDGHEATAAAALDAYLSGPTAAATPR